MSRRPVHHAVCLVALQGTRVLHRIAQTVLFADVASMLCVAHQLHPQLLLITQSGFN